MNEAQTRAELIDPRLRECGWGVVEGSKILREEKATITRGRIQTGGRGKGLKADYILVYKGIKLAVVEAKSDEVSVREGVMQAKLYAEKLQLDTTYSTNGKEIYQICMKTGTEGMVPRFLSPDELWAKTFPYASTETGADDTEKIAGQWMEKFAHVPFEDKSGFWDLRYYQEIAIQKTMEAVAEGRERILLTLATGTGKTAIAFQIAWKLYQTRWNLSNRLKRVKDSDSQEMLRRPRILFLADRNILADQAFNSFSSFPEDALVRIKPGEIKKKGRVPTNGNIFFTIFQTFMSDNAGEEKVLPFPKKNPSLLKAASPAKKPTLNFGQYPPDFFDFIIIDECHRGGANDESNWREILEYFRSAVQLGLTATPKRKDNVDTYRYFGEPIFVYSLKDGINDGFLTPFKVKRIWTTLDKYTFTPEDKILEGEIEEGREYEEKDFNRTIEIVERETKRVKVYLEECNQEEKAIVFCANQGHAALIRDLINQHASNDDPFYCVRVTANDGEQGEILLRKFQDNENTIPTILTTSQKLSTGVDARNIRNIVLLRPINSMIEFKQIVGRGTRLFDGKEFFTIYDFVDAHKHFSDPEWDGEPEEEPPCNRCNQRPCVCEKPEQPPCPVCGMQPCQCPKDPGEPCEKCGQSPCICPGRTKVKVKLGRGKERKIDHMLATSFWSPDGKPVSAEEYLKKLFGELPKFFKNEKELREIWSHPGTRKTFLEQLEDAGFPKTDLISLQKLVDMENSDLFDVLEYVFNGDYIPMSREERAIALQSKVATVLNPNQKEFISFVLSKYIETGFEELAQEKLPILLTHKYNSLEDAKRILGEVASISKLFLDFQKQLYSEGLA